MSLPVNPSAPRTPSIPTAGSVSSPIGIASGASTLSSARPASTSWLSCPVNAAFFLLATLWDCLTGLLARVLGCVGLLEPPIDTLILGGISFIENQVARSGPATYPYKVALAIKKDSSIVGTCTVKIQESQDPEALDPLREFCTRASAGLGTLLRGQEIGPNTSLTFSAFFLQEGSEEVSMLKMNRHFALSRGRILGDPEGEDSGRSYGCTAAGAQAMIEAYCGSREENGRYCDELSRFFFTDHRVRTSWLDRAFLNAYGALTS